MTGLDSIEDSSSTTSRSSDETLQVFISGLACSSVLSVEVSRSTTVWDLVSFLYRNRPGSLPWLSGVSCKGRADATLVTIGRRSVPCHFSLGELNIKPNTVIDISPNLKGGDNERFHPKKGSYDVQMKMLKFQAIMKKSNHHPIIRSLLIRNIGVKICRKCYRRNPYLNRTCRSRACGHSNIFRPKGGCHLKKSSIMSMARQKVQRAFSKLEYYLGSVLQRAELPKSRKIGLLLQETNN